MGTETEEYLPENWQGTIWLPTNFKVVKIWFKNVASLRLLKYSDRCMYRGPKLVDTIYEASLRKSGLYRVQIIWVIQPYQTTSAVCASIRFREIISANPVSSPPEACWCWKARVEKSAGSPTIEFSESKLGSRRLNISRETMVEDNLASGTLDNSRI